VRLRAPRKLNRTQSLDGFRHMTNRNRVEWWLSALCCVPWLLLVGPYVEICFARLVLSRWPRPMLDDPKELPTAPPHFVFQLLVLSLVVAIPLLIAFTAWNWRRILSDWRYSARVGAFAV
jgi:hypothetical protein